MKLTQKLAAVLAATMIVTAVPVVTMAASTTSITKVVTTTNTDDPLGANAPTLKIDLDDAFTGNEFYLQLEGAEWKDDKATTPQVITSEGNGTFERLGDKEAKITIPKGAIGNVEIKLQNAVVKKDEAIVIVDSNNTEVTDAKIVFARKSASKVKVEAKDAPSFYTGSNKIAKLVFEEPTGGVFQNGTYEFEVALDTDDYEFYNMKEEEGNKDSKLQAKGVRGLSNGTFTASIKDAKDDRATLVLEVSNLPSNASRGSVEITGIEIDSVTKTPSLGEIKMNIIGLKEDGKKDATKLIDETEFVIGTASEYGQTLKVKDDKTVKIGNGETEKVTFTLKEVTKDSFAARDVEFTLDQGEFHADNFKSGGKLEKLDKIYKDNDKEKEIIGFVKTLDGKDDKVEEYKFEDVKVSAPIGGSGDITLKVEGRGLAEEISVVIAEVEREFEIESKGMNIEVGKTGQIGGSITIKEADKGKLERGTKIKVAVPADSGIKFKEAKVEATGDMKVSIGDVKFDDKTTDGAYYVEVTVDRASKEAATITIKDFEVATNRAIADGAYDATVTMSNRAGEIELDKFMTVGEGIATTITTTITNGATEMVVNGAKVTLEAPAYLENGKMMVPLRAVAEAFGIPTKNIVYTAGNIAIFGNGRTISMTIGSTKATVNGAEMTLANPAKIVNERTTVPVGDLGRLLGLKVEWDNTTKTATFSN